ncbi:MAG: hypothetical protein QW732_03425 [Zestosphaera sp.]
MVCLYVLGIIYVFLNTPLLRRNEMSELLATAGDALSQAGREKNKPLRSRGLGGQTRKT